MECGKLSGSLHGFQAAIRVLRLSDNCSICYCKQCNRIQILHRLLAMHPKPLLSGALEMRIVTLNLRPQCVNFLECHAFTVNGKPCDTVEQDMIFVAPVELVIPLIDLICGSMYAKRTIRIGLRLIFLCKLVFAEGFRIALRGVCHDRRGIHSNK